MFCSASGCNTHVATHLTLAREELPNPFLSASLSNMMPFWMDTERTQESMQSKYTHGYNAHKLIQCISQLRKRLVGSVKSVSFALPVPLRK